MRQIAFRKKLSEIPVFLKLKIASLSHQRKVIFSCKKTYQNNFASGITFAFKLIAKVEIKLKTKPLTLTKGEEV